MKNITFHSLSKEFVLDFKMTLRDPAFTLPTLLFPLMFYLFFGLIFKNKGMEGQMPTYLMVTYGVFGIMSPALFGFGANVAMERDKGWLAIKQVAPMPPMQYLLAKLTTASVFAIIVVLGLFLLGAGFGEVNLSLWQWISLALLMVLGTLPFCALGLAIGFWVKGSAAIAVINLVFLPGAFLSGLWMPIRVFPEWLQKLALALPPFHLSQLGLKIVDMDLAYSPLMHSFVLVLMTLLFLVVGVKGYYRTRGQ